MLLSIAADKDRKETAFRWISPAGTTNLAFNLVDLFYLLVHNILCD